MNDQTAVRLRAVTEGDSGEDKTSEALQAVAGALLEGRQREDSHEHRRKNWVRYKLPGIVLAILGAMGYGGYEAATFPTEKIGEMELGIEKNAESIDALADHAANSEILDAARAKHLEAKIDAMAPSVAEAVEKPELLKQADDRAEDLMRKKRAEEIIRATDPIDH